jgi:F-type H+-transporting ATPase subunit delta
MIISRLAVRYAKALIGLAIEKGKANEVYQDMLLIKKMCAESREFTVLLHSPVVKPYRKEKILQALTDGRVTVITTNFNKLLVERTRESYLPEIAESYIEQYKEYKKIHVVKLTTAVPVSEKVKANFVSKVKEVSGVEHIELQTEVNPDIIGGFIFESEGRLVDASVAYDLNSIRNQYKKNEFVYSLR